MAVQERCDFVPVHEDDMLCARSARRLVEPELAENVESEGLTRTEHDSTAPHTIVERDGSSLAGCEIGVRREHEFQNPFPGFIILGIDGGFLDAFDLQNSGKHEIPKRIVLVAVGSRVPPESVKSDCM